MYHGFMSRWDLSLDQGVKRVYVIASLLNPGCKDYDFIDGLDFIPASDKAWALRELRTEWRHVWMKPQNQPKVNEATAVAAATASSSAAAAATADADAASDAARVTPGNAPATVALPETIHSVKAIVVMLPTPESAKYHCWGCLGAGPIVISNGTICYFYAIILFQSQIKLFIIGSWIIYPRLNK